MRRTPSHPSPHRATVASTRQRGAALFGLLALGFLLGHVHPAHHTDGHAESDRSDAPVVSDDTAHHEHSSQAVVDTAPCVGCRSFDDEALASPHSTRVESAEDRTPTLPEWNHGATRAPFAGLPATRAPPIA